MPERGPTPLAGTPFPPQSAPYGGSVRNYRIVIRRVAGRPCPKVLLSVRDEDQITSGGGRGIAASCSLEVLSVDKSQTSAAVLVPHLDSRSWSARVDPGALMARCIAHRAAGENVYAGIQSTDETMGGRWWLTRGQTRVKVPRSMAVSCAQHSCDRRSARATTLIAYSKVSATAARSGADVSIEMNPVLGEPFERPVTFWMSKWSCLATRRHP